jgi:FkbH-like protein
MAPNYSTATKEIIAAIINQAPACIRDKALLAAIDWGRVEPEMAGRLLARLEEEGLKPPAWLLADLLAGGHDIGAAGQDEKLSLAWRLLARLNRNEESDAEWIRITAADIAGREMDDPALALALVRKLKERGFAESALALALGNWRDAPQLLRPVSRLLKEARKQMEPARLRLMGYSTTHMLAEDMAIAMAREGFDANIDEAGFGEVMNELMQPSQEDYDAFILMLDMEGFHPRDWRQGGEINLQLINERLEMLIAAMASFVKARGARLLCNAIPLPPSPALGFVDRHHASGQSAAVKLVNQRLAELAASESAITLVDSFCAFSHIAPQDWVDHKMWYYGRIPYGPAASRALAGAFAKAWRAEKRGPAKVLAIDLDNTMWGGIYGEDGVSGLECGDDFPGNAFKAMQGEFLRLKQQGMLLAILSKNNPDAIEVFAKHPGMLLKEEDIIAHRINWRPKPQNIAELAEELNLGLDSFVFLDDSPHEREAMRALAPQAFTPELPADPARRPAFLRSLSLTWPIRPTDEDARRSSMYMAERKARELKSSAASFEDYLRGLEQKLTIEEASEASLPRVAQMHIRTNQFNLTTERLDEAAIREMTEKPREHMVVLGQATDKFGDHGVIIAATANIDGERAELRTLLMSCRVIGREIEFAFIGELLKRLAQRGVKEVRASYLPTAKNHIVADLYERCGFDKTGEKDGATYWLWRRGDEPPSSRFVDAIWRESDGQPAS